MVKSRISSIVLAFQQVSFSGQPPRLIRLKLLHLITIYIYIYGHHTTNKFLRKSIRFPQYEGAVATGGRKPSIWDNFTHTYPGLISTVPHPCIYLYLHKLIVVISDLFVALQKELRMAAMEMLQKIFTTVIRFGEDYLFFIYVCHIYVAGFFSLLCIEYYKISYMSFNKLKCDDYNHRKM